MASPRKRLPREQRKREIIEAALEVFATKGYRKASISELNETAGIARGTFYLYFDSKKDVFLEIIESYFRQYAKILKDNQDRLEQAIEKGYDPLRIWRKNTVDVLRFHSENPELTEIVYRQGIGMDEDFSARFMELSTIARKKLSDDLSLMAEGGLLRNVDLEVAISMAIGAITYIILDLVLREPRADLEKLADEFVDSQIRALASPRINPEKAIQASKAGRTGK